MPVRVRFPFRVRRLKAKKICFESFFLYSERESSTCGGVAELSSSADFAFAIFVLLSVLALKTSFQPNTPQTDNLRLNLPSLVSSQLLRSLDFWLCKRVLFGVCSVVSTKTQSKKYALSLFFVLGTGIVNRWRFGRLVADFFEIGLCKLAYK